MSEDPQPHAPASGVRPAPMPHGRFEDLRRPTASASDASFLEMLDIVNERLIDEGDDPDRVRPRLPRGHLRHLRRDDQRPGPRAREGHRHLPAPHAQVQRRRHIVIEPWRAAAVPGHQGPGGRPLAPRPHHRSRRLHLGAAPASAPDANLIPSPSDAADVGHGCRGLHRLWRLRGRLPELGRPALHLGARSQHLNPLPQGQAERWTARSDMVETMEQFFGSCTNHGECTEACPKEICPTSSPT